MKPYYRLALALSGTWWTACAAEPPLPTELDSDAAELALFASPENEAFIERVAPGARRGFAEFGVPASVTIAQAILESGWGRSAPGNNYFGIKCVSPSSPGPIATGCQSLATRECNASGCYPTTSYFRVYASIDDSMRDHGAFLRNNSRYAQAFRYSSDPNQFVREVAKAGYATDPNYANSVISLMQANNLYRFDAGGAVGSDNCTDAERAGFATTGCACVDHRPSGGFCAGSGCTAVEERNCAAFGTQCVDHKCSGGFAPGSGCTALEERNCAAVGTQCVDHKCSGGFAPGSGCTALEERNCAAFGTQCVDHKCSGGFGPGSGCTALEERNCAAVGTQCVDHQCSGGFGSGNGCTAYEMRGCEAAGKSCRDHACR